MAVAPTLFTRPCLLTEPSGATTPAVLLVEADGTLIRMLDALQIDGFLSSVRTCAETAVAAHEQQRAASPADRALLQAQPEGRA